MKKIYILITIFLSLFIVSCNKKTIEIKNMNELNGEYYKTIDETVEFIIITDYVDASSTYIVETIPELEVNGQLTYLKNGDNLFIIKFDNKEYKLHFYKEYKVLVEIYDQLNNELYSFKVSANSNLDFDEIKEQVILSGGYSWDGTVIYNEETFNINNLTATSNMKLTAVLNLIDYNISIKSDQGLFNDYTITLNTGDIIEVNAPKIKGYEFIGIFDGNELIPEGMKYTPGLGCEFILKYEKEVYQLTYKYDNNKKNINISYNDLIEEFVPTKTGYDFIGWMLNGSVFDKEYFEFTENIVLEAMFTPKNYEISYDVDGVITKEKVAYGSKISLSTPSKEGYTFKGWYLENTLFEEDTYLYDKNITLKAMFEKEQPIQKVTLNLEAFGGVVSNEVTTNVSGIINLPVPSKEEFNFVGWYYDLQYQNKVTNINYLDYNNELLYAKYEHTNEGYIDSFVISKFNEHISTYDVLTMFDSNQSGFTSRYWHKIGIKLIGDSYYISAIAQNGDTLSTLGDYDYIIMAYMEYDLYNDFAGMSVEKGYQVIFSDDLTSLEKGTVCVLATFIHLEVDYSEYYKEIESHLQNVYSKYTTVEENIELIENYNNIPISWLSSNSAVISNTGIFRAPKNDTNVTLMAYVNDEKVYEFKVSIKGTGGTKALATGYIYTPYNTITQNAMNTLDIIYCAFLEFDANGNFTNLSRMKSNITNYIQPLADKSGTKIVISVNQSASGAFSSVAASATLREKLANNILDFIKTMNIDGVDIDWEVPSSSEIENFTLLMKIIYEKVKAENPNYLVTAAIGGGKWQPPKYDLTNSKKYLDYVNLMTYSMATGNGYYQNALYKSSKGATLTSCTIEESVKIFNDYGIENSKILVGIPFYLTVQTESGGPGSKTGTGKSIWYDKLYSTYALSDTMKEYFDEECGVPYRYDAVNKIFISFENEQSIKRKCEYINAMGLAGIMYWQYGQDVDDYLSNAIAKYINGA